MARRSNRSVLEEINPDCSLEGQILRMKLKYFGHLMRRKDSLEKSLMLGTIDGKRRRGRQRMRWLDGVTEAVGVSLSGLQGMVEDRKAWRNVVQGISRWVRHNFATNNNMARLKVTYINRMVLKPSHLRNTLKRIRGSADGQHEAVPWDLVNEKLKTQQMNNDLEKLTHELEKIGLNKERLLHDEQSSDDSKYKLLESRLESTLKKSLEIKEEKIAALEARLEESTNLNQQLRQELKTVKKNYEALKQRQEEEKMLQNCSSRSGEETQPVNKWERESQETTKELLKVKDRLIEVERNNATLQAEKQALKTQLKQLETQNNNLQAQILALQRQTVSLQEQNTTLQTQNAKLQVENSAINSQSTSLMNQNAQLLIQQSALENENESIIKEREDLRTLYDSLIKDHEKLEQLHERQAAEYESLISKHGNLKSAHKNLEVEHKDLEDRYNQLLKQKVQLEELEKIVKTEQEKMLQQNKKHETVAAEYKKLCEDNDRLNHIYTQLLKDNEVLQVDHKNLKTLLNNSKLEQTRLEAEFSKLKEQYQQLDITYTKLNNQCELLSQLKGNLEEENRHLLDQIQTLMLQNKTLLEQNMESKDLFHVEQRQYIDKLNELRRQKEKLEEKIMDQYKFYEPSPPRRRGNWITLKMKKLIKPKKDLNRERFKSLTLTPTRSESSEGFLQLPHQDSQDSSSVGSNSLEDGQTVGTKKSSTMNDLMQSMVLAGGQWTGSSEHLEGPDDLSTGKRRKELGSMAFSTTSINFATVNSAAGLRSKQLLNNKDATSFEDVSPQGISDDSSTGSRIHASRPASLDSGRTSASNSNNNASLHEVKAGAVNNQSRPQSHSSGEFSLLHDHEAWSSSSSSPIQYLKSQTRSSPMIHHKMTETVDKQGTRRIKTDSPGSEVVTLQQFLEESNKVTSTEMKASNQDNLLDEVMKIFSENAELTGRHKLRKQSSDSSGIARSQSVRSTTEFSDGKLIKPSSCRMEDPSFSNSSKTLKAGTKGRTKSVKENMQSQRQSKDCNPYATLPRASNVISTAEGTTRRTSIHDFLSKDTRQPVSIDPSPPTSDRSIASASSEYSPQQQSSVFNCTPYAVVTMSENDLGSITSLDHSASNSEKLRNSKIGEKDSIAKTFSCNNICSDKVGTSVGLISRLSTVRLSRPFLALNTELVSNVSGLPQRPLLKTADKMFDPSVKYPQKDHKFPSLDQKSGDRNKDVTQTSSEFTTLAQSKTSDSESPLPVSEDTQTIWYEYGCV
ncbi:Girdin [Varanus komodoensis]|nr:Girdin [Varanus komodoensis]